MFQFPIDLHELIPLTRSRPPSPKIHQHFWPVRVRIQEKIQFRSQPMADWAEPKRVKALVLIQKIKEFLRFGFTDRDVLDYILPRESTLVQCAIEDTCVHVFIEYPTGEAVERKHEVFEPVHS